MYQRLNDVHFQKQFMKLGIGIILFLTGIFILVAQSSYFIAWGQGGSYWTVDDFQHSATWPDEIHFAHLDALHGGYTGVMDDHESARNRIGEIFFDLLFDSKTYYGYAFLSPNHIMIFITGNAPVEFGETRRLTGTLKPIDSRISITVRNALKNKLTGDLNTIYLLPYYLDTIQVEQGGAWFIMAGIGLFCLLVGGWFLMVGIEGVLASTARSS